MSALAWIAIVASVGSVAKPMPATQAASLNGFVRLSTLQFENTATENASWLIASSAPVAAQMSKDVILALPSNPDVSQFKLVLEIKVPASTNRFRGFFGVPDMVESGARLSQFRAWIGNDEAFTGLTRSNQAPAAFEIAVQPGSMLTLELSNGAALIDAGFDTKGAPPVPVTNELPRVVLLSPQSNAVSTEKVSATWQSIKGAVAYGVEIVLINSAVADRTTRYLRAFTVRDTRFEWLLNGDVTPGDYQISVIAFGPKGVISKFSSPRRFKIAPPKKS